MSSKLSELFGTININISPLPGYIAVAGIEQEKVRATAFAAFGEYGDDCWEWVKRESEHSVNTVFYWMDWALTGRYEFPLSMTGWQKRKENVRQLITHLEQHNKYFGV